MTEANQQEMGRRKRKPSSATRSSTMKVKPDEKPELPAEAKPEVYEKVMYVGQKPVRNYVIACLTSFNAGSTKIIVKARGRAICKAVDTIELLRRRFMKNVELQGISIKTEQVTREGDRKTNVSAIEITVAKT